MSKTKEPHPVDKLADELKEAGVDAQGFRFASGVPLILVRSRKNGYKVWVALHLNEKDEWPREHIEMFVHTNFGAMIATGFGDIKQKLTNRAFLEHEDRMRLADLLTISDRAMFSQETILKTLSTSTSS